MNIFSQPRSHTHFINYRVLCNKYHTYLNINHSSQVMNKLCIIKQVLFIYFFIKRVSPHINVKRQNCNNLIIIIHLSTFHSTHPKPRTLIVIIKKKITAKHIKVFTIRASVQTKSEKTLKKNSIYY